MHAFKNVHFIVTAGPTREYLDPVRFISNPSSGKMGYFLALECLRQSPHVTFIHGPIAKSLIPNESENIRFESTDELLECLMAKLDSLKDKSMILIMAAAPGDYKSKNFHQKKIKKSNETLEISLVRNPDILLEIDKKKKNFPKLFRVGFAAESHHATQHGLEKLKKKNLDMIVVNNILKKSSGFQSDFNEVEVIQKEGVSKKIPKAHKETVAREILNEIEKYF